MSEAKPTVFVVDDDPEMREALDGLLRSLGLQSKPLASVREFLQAQRPDGPACLILDVRLPGAKRAGLSARLVGIGVRSTDHLHHRAW